MPEIDAKTGEEKKQKSEKTLRLEEAEKQLKAQGETIAKLNAEIESLKTPPKPTTDADEWLDG